MDNEDAEAYSLKSQVQKDFNLRTWRWFASTTVPKLEGAKFENVIDFVCGTGETTLNLKHWISTMMASQFPNTDV